MMNLFHEVSQDCSRITTEKYSTSFSSAIRLLHKDLRTPICNIYGFVRFADEIVDTFHGYDKAMLFEEFKKATYDAIERGISLNPILHSFQMTVNQYKIDHALIDAFLYSMELDLGKHTYDRAGYETYIYGSAEVVGLMCLYIFCDGNQAQYDALKPAAKSLGSEFQKVNFLRDLKDDNLVLNRTYFPGVDLNSFDENAKQAIISEIEEDFKVAFQGITKLPMEAKFGVYTAYVYYKKLLNKLEKTPSHKIGTARIRVSNYTKAGLLAQSFVTYKLKLV